MYVRFMELQGAAAAGVIAPSAGRSCPPEPGLPRASEPVTSGSCLPEPGSPGRVAAGPAAPDSVAFELGPSGPCTAEALAEVRDAQREMAAAQARQVQGVARLVAQCRAEARDRLAGLSAAGETGHDAVRETDVEELTGALAVDTVSCALGIGRSAAADLVELSTRLTCVLPAVLAAWSAGSLDADRVRVLARATEVLDDATARRVVSALLPSPGSAPWQGLSPRRWRTRVERAVVRADAQAAARRRAAAIAARRVRAWADGDGTGVLQLRAEVADVALADQVVSDLARAWPATDTDGVRLSMDQRRADALMDLFRAVRDGSLARYPEPAADDVAEAVPGTAAGAAFGIGAGTDTASGVCLPRVPVRRVHDLGLVLHADTLFDDGPAADDSALVRGLGRPGVVDPSSARRLARRQLRQGTAVQVLVVDATGAVERVVRLDGRAAGHCISRRTLVTAVRAAITTAPPLSTCGHHPAESIARHVRAEAPTCSFYDCPRRARSCDLDHDTPWPRGPTSVTNLDPKCRRHHNAKTLALARTRLTAGPGAGTRTVHWTLPGGITVTTTPEPLPGADALSP
jgi:hypothetical protein